MFPQLFRAKSSKDTAEKEDMNEAFKTLMHARFDRLEQNFTALRTEWADTYDKIMHLYDRSRKRIKSVENAAERENDTAPIAVPISDTEQREMILRAYRNENGRF